MHIYNQSEVIKGVLLICKKALNAWNVMYVLEQNRSICIKIDRVFHDFLEILIEVALIRSNKITALIIVQNLPWLLKHFTGIPKFHFSSAFYGSRITIAAQTKTHR